MHFQFNADSKYRMQEISPCNTKRVKQIARAFSESIHEMMHATSCAHHVRSKTPKNRKLNKHISGFDYSSLATFWTECLAASIFPPDASWLVATCSRMPAAIPARVPLNTRGSLRVPGSEHGCCQLPPNTILPWLPYILCETIC